MDLKTNGILLRWLSSHFKIWTDHHHVHHYHHKPIFTAWNQSPLRESEGYGVLLLIYNYFTSLCRHRLHIHFIFITTLGVCTSGGTLMLANPWKPAQRVLANVYEPLHFCGYSLLFRGQFVKRPITEKNSNNPHEWRSSVENVTVIFRV